MSRFESLKEAHQALQKAKFSIRKILTRDLCFVDPSKRTVSRWFRKLGGMPQFRITKDILLELEMSRLSAEAFIRFTQLSETELEETWTA